MADKRLQVFFTVGKMLSFTKAAACLEMTQPAVTFQVRQLEEEYKVRLFDRAHNKIDLTEAGKSVYAFAERIFTVYSEMDYCMREMVGEVSGNLRIGAGQLSAQYLIPALLAEFQEEHKKIHIKLQVASNYNIISLIENNFIDVGVISGNKKINNMVLEPFYQQELVLAVPKQHELAKYEQVTMNELIRFSWIMSEESSSIREIINQYLLDSNVDMNDLNITMELGSAEAIKTAIESGRGISILPKETFAKEVALGTLVAINFDKKMTQSVSFIYKEQKFPLKVVSELINYVKEISDIDYLPRSSNTILES